LRMDHSFNGFSALTSSDRPKYSGPPWVTPYARPSALGGPLKPLPSRHEGNLLFKTRQH